MATEHSFYRATRPPAPLRGLIHSFWIYDGYHPVHSIERVLPTATAELIVPLDAQRLRATGLDGAVQTFRGALLSGPRRTAFDIPTDQQARLAGVHFLPGGAWPLLGVPMDSLVDAHVPLSELDRAATDDVQRLVDARDDATRFDALASFFMRRLERTRPGHLAVAAALRMMGVDAAVPVATIVERVGLSHRRFNELFGREVGPSPRDFLRVGRLHRALVRARSLPAVRGAEIAYEVGFVDQSHLLLECKKLTGLSLRALSAPGRAAAIPVEERLQVLPIG